MGTLITIIIGITAGIILATPPGVINLTILNCLAQNKRRQAIWIGAGSATLDVFYGALAIFSASAIYAALFGFIKNNPNLMLFLEIVFIVAIIWFGLIKVLTKEKKSAFSKKAELPKRYRKFHPYYIGCIMALTHIIVPAFLPSYAYMAAILLDTKLIPDNNFHYLLFALMFGLGNLLWVFGIVGLYGRHQHKLTNKHFRVFDKILGFLFLVIGIGMVLRLLVP